MISFLGALTGAVLAPLILAWLLTRQQTKAKQADWKREDEREAKAIAARQAVADETRQVASELVLSRDRLAAAAADVRDQAALAAATQDHIADQLADLATVTQSTHALVNSNYSEALQRELDSLRREVVGLQEIVGLNQEAGRAPSAAALTVIEETRQRIRELELELAERKS